MKITYLLLGLLVGACSGTPVKAPDTQYLEPGELSDADRFMPLEDRVVYTYDTRSARGEEGVMTIQVRRTRKDMVDLDFGGKLLHVRLDSGGIGFVDGGYLLKAPLGESATWEGKLGPVRVTSVKDEVLVPAGRFRGCIRTEERAVGGVSPVQIASVYCPHVGLVSIDVATARGERRVALLRSFGPRIDPMSEDVSAEAAD